jgi:hypothetical protein
VGDGAATIYGWLFGWNTSSVADGDYSLSCSAIYPNDGPGQGPSISLTVAN